MKPKYKLLVGSVQQNGLELTASMLPSNNSGGTRRVKVNINKLLQTDIYSGEALEPTLSKHLEKLEAGEETPLELAIY